MKCPLCFDENIDFIEKYYSSVNYINYTLYRCNKCNLKFFRPFVSAKRNYYESTYHEWYGERWEFFKSFSLIPNDTKNILEIACGEGYFLNLALKKNKKVVGIDLNKRAILKAKEKTNINTIFNCTLDEFVKIKNEQKFDVIVFFHLLEHIDNIHEFFKLIQKMLCKKGIILISVPSPKRLEIHYKMRESWDFPPHHLSWWNEKSIKYLAKINKLEVNSIIFEQLKFKETIKYLLSGYNQIKYNSIGKTIKFIVFPFFMAKYIYLRFINKISGQSMLIVLKG